LEFRIVAARITIEPIMAAYSAHDRVLGVEELGNAGGFSGARFWRLTTADGPLCLRRWPVECQREKLRFVHTVLRFAAASGFRLAPLPMLTSDGETFVAAGGHLWELSPWVPGAANYHERPSPERLTAAMRALAEFHLAVVEFPGSPAAPLPSPGIADRIRIIETWRGGDLERLERIVAAAADSQLTDLAKQILRLFRPAADPLLAELKSAAHLRVAQQPCIRDIWDQHVLFVEDRVSGIIDFGSMRFDNVATDVARLLGSMAAGDPQQWEAGLQAYAAARPLSDAEQRLINAFDRSTVLLSGMNWLRWLFLDDRRFDDMSAVIGRLQSIHRRLARV
jgi:homoserine kinase type II